MLIQHAGKLRRDCGGGSPGQNDEERGSEHDHTVDLGKRSTIACLSFWTVARDGWPAGEAGRLHF
jgi:hypothetical protein